MNRNSGFTLIELLIVMAIVAILGVVAIPSYRNYIVGARQNSAEQSLLRMASSMENCYSLNQTYVGCFGANANTGVTDFLNANDLNGHYRAGNRTNITARDYVLVVEATGSQARSVEPGCLFLAIDRIGRKLVSNGGETFTVDGANNAARCWQ